MRILIALAIATAAHADVADFDDLPEGFAGQVFTSGGITFSEGRWFPNNPNDTSFAIEQADGDMPGFGWDEIYSAPNIMTVGGFTSGPGMAFVRVHSWKADVPGSTFTDGSVDVFYIDDFPGAVLMLEGLIGDDVINSVSIPTAGIGPFATHAHLSFSGPEYETLRFRIMGGPQQDGLTAAFDNVVMESAGCAADCNGDGNLDVLDFVCFQQEWQGKTEFGDCNNDGMYNVLDFVCFQGVFQKGCP